MNNDDQNLTISDEESGENAVSGSNPDVDSDDNMLDNAHEMGLYENSSEEDQEELNIAEQVEQAEKAHRDA